MQRRTWFVCAPTVTLVVLFAAPGVGQGQEKPAAATAVPGIRVAPALSKPEEDIYRALRETTDLELIDTPLEELANIIETKHRIQVELDRKALEEVGVSKDSQITRNLKGVTLRSALRLILRDFDLKYVVQDEVLLITSAEKAGKTLVTRVYDVGDLLTTQHEDGEIEYDPDTLLNLVTTTVEPQQWREAGGAATATVHRNAFVVSAPYQMHEELESLLVSLQQTFRREREAGEVNRAATVRERRWSSGFSLRRATQPKG